jgi:hypothetical protein
MSVSENHTLLPRDELSEFIAIAFEAPLKLRPISTKEIRSRVSHIIVNHVEPEDLNQEERDWFGMVLSTGKVTQQKLADLYGLKRGTVRDWLYKFRNGSKHVAPGRPTKLELPQLKNISVDVRAAYFGRCPLSRDDVKEKLHAAAAANYLSRHPNATPLEVEANASFCDKTESTYRQKLDAYESKTQHATFARFDACMDVRHSYSWMIAHEAFAKHSPANLKNNADATTFIINWSRVDGDTVMVPTRGSRMKYADGFPSDEEDGTDEGNESYEEKATHDNDDEYKCEKNDENIPPNLRPQSYGASEMDTIIKHIHLASASGHTNGVCLIFEDSTISVDFHYFELTRLDVPTQCMTACVYICKSRAGNDSMWKHWFLTQAIPFCKLMQSHSSEQHADLSTFFSTDGERIILKQALQDEVFSAFNQANIIYARVPAATTAIHQANDRSMFFRKIKATLKSRSKLRKIRNCHVMNELLASEIETKLKYDTLTAGLKRTIKKSILLVEQVFGRCLDRFEVSKSFEVCGQHVFNRPDETAPTCDSRKIMQQCYNYMEVTHEQKTNMMQHVDFFVQSMKDKGFLSWEDLEEKNICNINGMNREGFSMTRHACEIVTNENIRRRQKQWDMEHDSAYIEAKKKLEKFQKLHDKKIADETKEDEKEAERRRQEQSQNANSKKKRKTREPTPKQIAKKQKKDENTKAKKQKSVHAYETAKTAAHDSLGVYQRFGVNLDDNTKAALDC